MSLFDDLVAASFKGVSFYLSDSNISGGRKDIRHSFPNSGKQTIEDLGLKPRVYNIAAKIGGENYIVNRNSLLRVLESDTPGILSHPFYGEISNVKARTYTIKESITDVGIAELSIVFEVTDNTGIISSITTTPSTVSAANEKVKEAVKESIKNTWKVTPKHSGNFEAAVKKITDYSDSVSGVSNTVVKNVEVLNDFDNSLNDLSDNVYSHVLNADTLSDSVLELTNNLDELFTLPADKFKVFETFFSFGDDDDTYTTYTKGILERESNNSLINNSIKVLALSNAFNAAVNIDYLTVTELDNVTDILDTQHVTITSLPGYSSDKNSVVGIDVDVRDSLNLMRQEANKLLTNIRENINSVISIDTNDTTARLLAYQYYGSSDNGEDIANINNSNDLSFISGSVKVLS